jgi:hypothetical protein
MTRTEENNNGDGEGRAFNNSLLNSQEDIEAFGQEYFASDFPNPQREGCPSPRQLAANARSGKAPDDELRAHLFSCSECFSEFREAMTLKPASSDSWSKRLLAILWLPPLRWAAPLATLSLLLVVVFFVARDRHQSTQIATDHQPSVNKTRPAPEAQKLENMNRDVSPVPAASPQLPEHLSLRVVSVDLRTDHLTRGADRSTVTQATIELRPERQRVRLTLPRGSQPGQYDVSLEDAFGKSVAVSKARSRGSVVMTILDLSKAQPGSYRLCAARAGEAPDCCTVILGR